jgi:hypothetical protein
MRGRWWYVWWRRERFLRARRFKEMHALNVMLWSMAQDEYWPFMAIRGPWAGMAEDLADESLNRQNTSDPRKQTLT